MVRVLYVPQPLFYAVQLICDLTLLFRKLPFAFHQLEFSRAEPQPQLVTFTV